MYGTYTMKNNFLRSISLLTVLLVLGFFLSTISSSTYTINTYASAINAALDIIDRYNTQGVSQLSPESKRELKKDINRAVQSLDIEMSSSNATESTFRAQANFLRTKAATVAGIQSNINTKNSSITAKSSEISVAHQQYNTKVRACNKNKNAKTRNTCIANAKKARDHVIQSSNATIRTLQTEVVALTSQLGPKTESQLLSEASQFVTRADQQRAVGAQLSTAIQDIEAFSQRMFGESRPMIAGCTDASANNFEEGLTSDDGSCEYDNGDDTPDEVLGCDDASASNYNSFTTRNDGSCTYLGNECCNDPQAINYDQACYYRGGLDQQYREMYCRYDTGCDLCSTSATNPNENYGDEHRFTAVVTWFGGASDPVPGRNEPAAIKKNPDGSPVMMDDLDTDNALFVAWPMTKGETALDIPHLATCFDLVPGTEDANDAINKAFEETYDVTVCNYSSPTGAEICATAEVVDRGPADPNRFDMSKALMQTLRLNDGQQADLSVQIHPKQRYGGSCGAGGFDN